MITFGNTSTNIHVATTNSFNILGSCYIMVSVFKEIPKFNTNEINEIGRLDCRKDLAEKAAVEIDRCAYYTITECTVEKINRSGLIDAIRWESYNKIQELAIALGITNYTLSGPSYIKKVARKLRVRQVYTVNRENTIIRQSCKFVLLKEKKRYLEALDKRYPKYNIIEYSQRPFKILAEKKAILLGPIYGVHRDDNIRQLSRAWLKLQKSVDADILIHTDNWLYCQPPWWKLPGSWLDELTEKEMKELRMLYEQTRDPKLIKALSDLVPRNFLEYIEGRKHVEERARWAFE